jgi:hypothetical protein
MTIVTPPLLNPLSAGVAVSIGSEPVKAKPAGGISSLLRNTSVHAPLFPIDTISLRKVGVSVDDNQVTVYIEGDKELAKSKWLLPTMGSLVELLWLPENWNSYGGKQIQPKAVEKALEALVELLDKDMAPRL